MGKQSHTQCVFIVQGLKVLVLAASTFYSSCGSQGVTTVDDPGERMILQENRFEIGIGFELKLRYLVGVICDGLVANLQGFKFCDVGWMRGVFVCHKFLSPGIRGVYVNLSIRNTTNYSIFIDLHYQQEGDLSTTMYLSST